MIKPTKRALGDRGAASLLSGVRCRKSEMRWTKKSLSFRLANKKFILFLVLMETGQGSTLLLSAFSTTDTCRA